MKLSAVLKTVGFAAACLIWLLAGAILLGPLIGERFMSSLDNGPNQPLASLICPQRVAPGDMAEIVARYANHSGRAQNYETSIEIQQGNASTESTSATCSRAESVPDGQAGETHCAFGPIDQVTRVRVTAWAEGESYLHTCELGCPNSYRSTCVIMPDIWTMLSRPDTIMIHGAIIVVGILLVLSGMALWRGLGHNGHVVMAVAFAAPAFVFALVFAAEFRHWLPAAILLVVLVKATLVAALWLRSHPA